MSQQNNEEILVALPVGMTEFDVFVKDLIENYDLPTKNEDSVKFTLASIIMHLGPNDDRKSKEFFVRTIRAAAAKQVAGQVFYDIKQKQKEAELAASRVVEVANEPVQAV